MSSPRSRFKSGQLSLMIFDFASLCRAGALHVQVALKRSAFTTECAFSLDPVHLWGWGKQRMNVLGG